MDCIISWKNSIKRRRYSGHVIFRIHSPGIDTYEWSMRCYFFFNFYLSSGHRHFCSHLCVSSYVRELSKPKCWGRVHTALNNQEGCSISPKGQWARGLHGILQVGRLPGYFLLGLIFFFLLLILLMLWKLLCSHPLLLVSKHTLNLHMPKRRGKPYFNAQKT